MMMMEEAELCFPQLNTSCWKPKRPHSQTLFIYTVLSCISLLTVTLNLLVIVSISHFMQLHTCTNILLLSLAVSDFFVGFLWMFQMMLIDGCWLLGDLMCTIYYVLDYICTSTSVGILVLISIDRYVAICDPLHYSTKVTPKRVQACVFLCWFFSLFVLSMLLKDNLRSPGRYISCVGECVIVSNVSERVADLILTFIIPITVIIVLYMRVFIVAVSQARAVQSNIGALSLQNPQNTAKKSEIKAARTLGLVIAVFLLCVCPYFCITLLDHLSLLNTSSVSFVICLVYFNSCLNPLIYVFFYPWFRKAITLLVTLKILKPGSRNTNMR